MAILAEHNGNISPKPEMYLQHLSYQRGGAQPLTHHVEESTPSAVYSATACFHADSKAKRVIVLLVKDIPEKA